DGGVRRDRNRGTYAAEPSQAR
ncbi:MAG: hypothetical protein QOF29_2229, partial [bacterium]